MTLTELRDPGADLHLGLGMKTIQFCSSEMLSKLLYKKIPSYLVIRHRQALVMCLKAFLGHV